ncbi:MAG: hypothetical protein ACLQVI_18400 [Polyangiaceae bacterium]|jgi:hypothetical protein
MGTPGPEHLIFIPGVLMIGIVLGYILGTRSARDQIDRRRKRNRE